MKIISSISRRCCPPLLALLFSCSAFGEQLVETTSFPDSRYQVSSHCDDVKGSQACTIYLLGSQEKTKLLEFPLPPSSISLEGGVFIILFPCGTQCSATYFYSHTNGLSGPFPLLVNYDIQQGIAVGASTNPIQIYRLFQEKPGTLLGKITLDLPQGREFDPSSIIDVNIRKKSIDVEYLNKEGKAVTVSHPIQK
ncbi:hypothetical protein ACV33W_27880 [Pseudomonas aeruginosa]